MNTSTVFRQVRVLDPFANTDMIADVWLNDGKIQAIDPHLNVISPETTIIEAQGLILGTGLVDLYSYSGEPGFEDRETLTSLAAAAIAGGFTRVAILPQTKPGVDNAATFSFLQQKAQTLPNSPHLHFWGNLTLGGQGKQMTELAELAMAGVVGFTDGQSIENLGLLRRILEYLKPLEKPVALVPESSSLKGNGVMREGLLSIHYGLPGNPAIAESSAIATILEIVAEINTPVHLMGISTRRGVELMASAKARGLPITASTSWMHLLLDTHDISNYDPSLRLEPPLGNPEDRQALIEGVREGIIDAIAVNHRSLTYEEKTVAFAEAPTGAIGLELALPLLWDQLVVQGEWSPLQLWKALSCYPCQCLGLEVAGLQVGQPAELILFDPQKTWQVDGTTLQCLGRNTPWYQQEIKGRVITSFVGKENNTLT
ncbi:dihydroorotase, multifunctional complex type [Rippkaea orientalis PCC 8801]|uniref:Dihydroorotase, multifunctional complex type n=1 Tax=Rippkaea orientalis (strain PCC 8801 / RF-1) TaxID=41431 RepID=B7K083_RIPO1|nr:dihydroorotase [Rippkaea orientalis]ACK66230.1 dihydroorotase, multifunctional complex type [Rippkaea orientalis PCC 8801]